MVQAIFILGATGFIGSVVCERLVQDGYRVIIGKRSSSDTHRIDHLLSQVTVYDLDTMSLEDILKKQPIDVVINLATDYGRGKDTRPSELCATNIIFPLQLIEEAVRAKVKYYWNIDSYWNTDSSLEESLTLYAYTKKVVKEILHHEFTSVISVFNLRLFHVFGEHDNPTKFLSHVVRTLRSNDALEMTDGKQQLDFTHVGEVASIFSFILKNLNLFPEPFERFEVGTGKVTPLREVVERVRSILGSMSEIRYGVVPYRKNEITYAPADVSKLTQAGYMFQTTLEDGLKMLCASSEE